MKLSEITAQLKALGEQISGLLKVNTDRATAETLSGISAKVTSLEASATAEITAKTAEADSANQKLTTANAQLTAVNTELTAVNTALKSACAGLKIEVKEGATNVEMVSLIQTAVTSTLARLQVDSSKVPAGVPTTAAGTAVKKKSLDEEIRERQAATATK